MPTPLDEDHRPDLSAVEGATGTVARNLSAGTLVVLESTTWPGTTDEVARPILEASGLVAGDDFHLAFSPERIDPGNPKYGLRNTPKVVGGYTTACRDRAAAFYGQFIEQVVPVSGTREAEMAKLLENTYRHVNIALVNEMAIFCDELGVDLWESIEAAATKPFGFQKFLPGTGRRRTLHPRRPVLPVLHGAQARLPVPVRRAGPGDQRADAVLRGGPRAAAAQPAEEGRERLQGGCCSA